MVGLDIGAKLLKLVFSENGKVKAFKSVELPEDVISEGFVLDPVDFVKALSEAVSSAGVRGKKACVSLPSYFMLFKKITLPIATPEELEGMVGETIGEHVPFPPGDIYWDFHVLGVNASDERYEDILLVVAKKDYVDFVADLVSMSGLDVVGIEPFPISAYNALCPETSGKFCFVDMGYTYAKVFLFDEGHPVISRYVGYEKPGVFSMDPLVDELSKIIKPFSVGASDNDRFFLGGGLSSDELKLKLSESTGLNFELAHINGIDEGHLFVAAYGASISEVSV